MEELLKKKYVSSENNKEKTNTKKTTLILIRKYQISVVIAIIDLVPQISHNELTGNLFTLKLII